MSELSAGYGRGGPSGSPFPLIANYVLVFLVNDTVSKEHCLCSGSQSENDNHLCGTTLTAG